VTGEANVGHNDGIVSTGLGATNTVNLYRLPESGLRPADAVECAPHTVRLGPYTAGRLFVGRDEELAELDAALADGASVITTGLGGVGKSTLAHRYAETHRDRYNPVWWIDAEERAEIESGLAALARRLYPESAHLPDLEAAAWGRSWLSCHDGWLVILDNATAPADVADLLNDGISGRFLLTSRLATGWEELASPIPLGVLGSEQAFEIMARTAGRAELLKGSEALCEALGNLPLAVRMAAAYMRENNISAAHYLDRLVDPGGEVIAWTRTAGNPERTVARIWLVSLRRITDAHGTFALDLLRILAWFAPTDIPVSLLRGIPGRSIYEIDEALGRLRAYTLITGDQDEITVHRMVQAAARYAAKEEIAIAQAVETARRSALHLLSIAAPSSAVQALEAWVVWRRLVPHVDALTSRTAPQHDDAASLALLDREASYLRKQRQVARAIPLFERVVSGAIRCFGPDDPQTLFYRNNLAIAVRAAGDLQRATPLLEQSVADRERVLGPEHLDTLTSRNNLASAYRNAGDLRRAIALYEQVLTERERILGPEHPDTLDARNGLGSAYRTAGDLRRAIPLYEQTLTDRERILGPEHPDTLLSRSNLAYAYRLAGDLQRAVPLYEQVLSERERILGLAHPETLLSRNNLAYAYRASGDLARAIPMYEQTLTDRERILGPEHLDTLTSRNNLAYAYRASGDPGRALPLYEQTLAERERILGPEHPGTLLSRNNLASAYLAAGHLRWATELHERNLVDRERILGPEHPSTLTSRSNLARAYEAAGDVRRAIPLYEQTLAERERILGPEHPDTLTSHANLARAHQAAGSLAPAVPVADAEDGSP
jgi:tetratricopeptide (TPR) repeat protein